MKRNIQSLFDLSGKTAIVTGGAGWLGTAITEALIELGATVTIASRNKERASALLKEFGSKLCFVQMDIDEEVSIKQALSQVAEAGGGIDILINNSYSGTVNSLANTTTEEWQKNLSIGLAGPFTCIREVVPFMRRSGKGSIVNIASMYGLVSPDQRIYAGTPFQSSPAYGAAKAGLLQLTRYAACELASDNIRVNAISPGPFPGPATQTDEHFIQALASKAPVGRIGEPWEIKGAIALLASDASSFITGQNLSVDGGWTAW